MNISKITRFIVLTALFLIPLFALLAPVESLSHIFPFNVVNSLFFPFITGKTFYFRSLVEIAFFGWVLLNFVDAKYRPRISAMTVGVTLFTVIVLVADILGVNPLRSIWSNFERMEGWMTIIHLWMFFMVTSSVFGSHEKSKNLLHHWLHISTFVALIVAIYGLVQLGGGAEIHQGSTRLDASLGNAAYLAVYMLFHAFIAAYLFFVARTRKIANYQILQWVYGILGVLFGFVLFETATRGTILGFVGGVILALMLYAVFATKESKKSRIISGSVIVAIILAGIIFWQNRPDHFTKNNMPLNGLATFIQNHEVLNRLATISWEDNKTQARGYIWPMAVKGGVERPLFGWGQENFNYIFNTNYEPKMWSQEQWFDRAHNVFLDWFVASGFVGLLAYLALYVLFIIAVWRSSITTAEKSVLTGLIAGYAVHNIFVFDNLASYIMFFVMLTCVHAFNVGKPIAFLGTKEVANETAEYIVAPVVIVALVAMLYFCTIRPLQANTGLITALQSCSGGKPDAALFQDVFALNQYTANQEAREQLISCTGEVLVSQQIPGPTKQAFSQLVTKAIEAQIADAPKDARMYVLAGGMLNSVGEMQQAQGYLETAHKLTPKKQSVMFELATDYLNTGKSDEAIALLKEAYELDPSYPEAQTTYAIGLVIVGKEDEARKLFNNDPAIFETARMAQMYVQLKKYTQAIAIYTRFVAASSTDIQAKVQLAQVQFTAGMKWDATQTLSAITKDHPELKDQVDAAIKQIQASK